MRDPFVFDSRSEFCKSPYGAAPCGGRVTFHVRPLYAEGYSRCVLVAWREFSNSADTLELMPEGTDGDRTRFSGVLTVPQEPELIWYYFRLFRPDGSTRIQSHYDALFFFIIHNLLLFKSNISFDCTTSLLF